MSEDSVGIFDTPPERRQVRYAFIVAGLLIAVMCTLLAVPNVQLPEFTSVVPVTDTIIVFSDLVAAVLLYVQARVFRSRALTILASGFVFIALLLVAHMLTFPGTFAPMGLLGARVNTTGWLNSVARATFPVVVILYVLVRETESSLGAVVHRPSPRTAVGLVVAILLAIAVLLLTTVGHDLLPSLLVDRTRAVRSNLFMLNVVLTALSIVATIVLYRRCRSVLDMWLLVAMTAWMVLLPINALERGRFTFTFYGLYALMPASHLILSFALIGESSRLYVRLALSMAAQKRDRAAKMMSMNAMAAAFSHEIGQPLTAVTVSTMAGLNLLKREQPKISDAIEALRTSLDATKRTTDVMKSLGRMFARGPESTAQFNLNDLVRETVALLRRELTAEKIAILLHLDETVLPIQADRVQIQQVLINLLMNAVESIRETGRYPRRITLRSTSADRRTVLLEISDTGVGLTHGDMDRIFEPFVTTKPMGTGLGLPICRSIIESHGGSLWVSEGRRYATTFCLELPSYGAQAVEASTNDDGTAH